MLMTPILEEFAESNRDVVVAKSTDAKLRSTFAVNGVPHLILFSQGKVIGQNAGPLSHSELRSFVKQNTPLRTGE